jgi:hypothetical protein
MSERTQFQCYQVTQLNFLVSEYLLNIKEHETSAIANSRFCVFVVQNAVTNNLLFEKRHREKYE